MSGDGYSNPIVGGDGELIRSQIRSSDWTGPLSTVGWALLRNGTAYLANAVIRGTLRSLNYIAGVSGYNLDGTTGSAEFNDVTMRGTLRTVPAPSGSTIEITTVGNFGAVNLYSGDPSEQQPSSIASGSGAIGSEARWLGNDDGDGHVSQYMYAPSAGFTYGGGVEFDSTAADLGLFRVAPNMQVEAESLRHLDSLDGGTRNTSSTSYVTASTVAVFTFACPASRIFTVTVSGRLNTSTGAAADAACMGFEVRDGGAGGTVLFAASDNNAAIVRQSTIPQPASRTRVVDVGGAGVSPGDTLWISAMLRSNNGANTATMQQVTLVVQPSP